MKKFYALLLCFFLILFVGCTVQPNDQQITDLQDKITELESKITELEQENADQKNVIKEKEEEINNKDAQIESLTEQVNKLLEQLNKKPIIYTISVYDIDGEKLANKEIIGLEGDLLIDALKENFDVVSTQTEWGSLITSIEGSIVDPNYYLACYENDEYATVGADELVLENNDKIEYYAECFNTELDIVDLVVDQLIYDFMKKSVSAIFEKVDASGKSPFYDYYLTPAILMMKKLGYDQSIFNFNFSNAAAIKEVLEQKDWQAETDQNNFMKGGISLIALEGDTASFKEALNSQSTYNYWQAIITKALNIENEALSSTISGWTAPTASGDLSMMQLSAYSVYMTKEQLGTAAIDATYANLTETGVDCWGVNGASTAQFILGLCALGLNPREYTVTTETGTTDAIEILTTYVTDGGLKYQLDNDSADLGYTTPQGIAALLAYKAMRDHQLAEANPFTYLGN